jgi:hypothetical protein
VRLVARVFLTLQSALFLLSPLAWAEPTSHQPDPDQDSLPKNIMTLLDSRRNAGKALSAGNLLEQLTKSGFNPQNLDNEAIKEFLKNSPALKDSSNVKRLSEIIKNELNNPMGVDGWQKLLNPEIKNELNNAAGADEWKNLLSQLEDFNKLGVNQKGQPAPIDPKNPARAVKDPANSPSPAQNRAGTLERPKPGKDEQTSQIVRWLRDAPLSQDLLKDLGKAMSEEGASAGQSNFLESFQNEWKLMMGSTNGNSSFNRGDLFSDLKMPDLAPVHQAGPSSQSAIASSSGSGAEFGWTELLLVVLLAACIVLGYMLHRRAKRQQSEISITVDPCGTIDPQTIRTREDLVKAFDSLSVAKCGTDAANWNHRQIAQELGSKHPDRWDAVDRLAGLYEKARYAPVHDLFTEVEVADARARLTQIVGTDE